MGNGKGNSNDKSKAVAKLFEGHEIRSIWDTEKEDYYFSVVDVVAALTESGNPRSYWSTLKGRLTKEGSQLVTKCDQLKMKSSKDGKSYMTDVLMTEDIFRLVESIPSPKAEPFKLWLAKLGKERVDEAFDPEVGFDRLIGYYRQRGYSKEWIKTRLISIIDRLELTDAWANAGIKSGTEFAILTNDIYQGWSGMKASEYKAFKGLRKESLRDNMTRTELALANLGEVATKELIDARNPQGLAENRSIAKEGGTVAGNARKDLEQRIGKSVISNKNQLDYKYLDNEKRLSE